MGKKYLSLRLFLLTLFIIGIIILTFELLPQNYKMFVVIPSYIGGMLVERLTTNWCMEK